MPVYFDAYYKPCCDEYRSAYCYQNKTMSEYNPIVINWAGRAKRAGLSFFIVNLGVPWTLPINQCSRGIVLNVCCSSSLEGNYHTLPWLGRAWYKPVVFNLFTPADRKKRKNFYGPAAYNRKWVQQIIVIIL